MAPSRCLAPMLSAAALLAGCGEIPPPIIIDGSSTVYRISVAAQEDYSDSVPWTPRILVDYHGTGGGFGRYIRGEVDIIDASRPAKPEEERQAMAAGHDWTRFVVGHDGITIAVHNDNTFVEALSVEQLRELFRPESPIQTWKDLDPSWPDREIVVYTPDPDSGTYDSFIHEALKLDAQRDDVQPSADDNVLVTGIAGDADSIGYFGIAYYTAYRHRLRAVPIKANADAPAVSPTPEAIYGGHYRPLSRPLYIYVKDAAMRRPEMVDFVSFYLDRVAELAPKAGYVPPTDAERAENLDALRELLAMLPDSPSSLEEDRGTLDAE